MAEVKYNLGTLAVVPTGAVISFAGSTAPQGYLLCDGREVSRTDYPYLFDTIGTAYGEGDGSTTFNLPNLKDKFIEGTGTNALGTVKSAGLPDIHGALSTGFRLAYKAEGAFVKRGVDGNRNNVDNCGTTSAPACHSWEFHASRSNSIYGKSTTVQPPAVVMNYIIKY